jgi:Glycosyl hydrolase 36 superfamily, catalytic domain
VAGDAEQKGPNMNRREFLGFVGASGLSGIKLPEFATALRGAPSAAAAHSAATAAGTAAKPYGSGYFGEWITDQFGLPAFHYTCDQISDPKAVSPTHKIWRGATDQTHQVGNDRIVAAVSNFGYVQVRQDEGAPKFLNDYLPEESHYGGGIGFLTDGQQVVSTFYAGQGEGFQRILGEGYLQKTVTKKPYTVDQVIFAPFGDDPVLISAVTITNHGAQDASLRWVEYWGCQNYQLSFRAWMQAGIVKKSDAPQLRREFAARFTHEFRALPNRAGLIESQKFTGRSEKDTQMWEAVQASLKKDPSGFYGGPVPDFPARVSFEDLNPPRTFLVSLDAPADGMATDAASFFGAGGVEHPAGLGARLNGTLDSTGPSSAHLLERHLQLKPQETRTTYFMYGYLPEGFEVESLITKYSASPSKLWADSSAQWKNDGVRFSVSSEPWVERETSWHNYYLRSAMTYDGFFGEKILSQGHVYQYLMGFQGAARDPLQHTLPFVFSNPEVVKNIIRYTLKEILPDRSLPYAIVGSGVPMPAIFAPSDQEMWLLWTASEYILATRDTAFLAEKIPTYPNQKVTAEDPTVGELLHQSYIHMVKDLGTGAHGLMRLSNGDWNDGVIVSRQSADVSPEEIRKQSESVLNAAMASYVLGFYGSMLAYTGDTKTADEARAKAKAQREAVRATWQGRWFKRAWLGEKLGWIGDDHFWLEPQPWALIGGAATPEQSKILVSSMNQLVRDPSPIGAMLQSQADPNMTAKPGTMENGGIWPSINGTLIWALALVNGAQAWDEWKKNSLAMHAEKYPDVWYGTWSGPDVYNSVLSKYPGQTMFVEQKTDDKSFAADWGMNWTDFPVMNLHPHAWPLYSSAKLLGLDFHQKGIRFQPGLPLDEYEFTSPLLGFKKTKTGYAGWYAPSVVGKWELEFRLPAEELARLKQLKINGASMSAKVADGAIRFWGDSAPGAPLRWEIS